MRYGRLKRSGLLRALVLLIGLLAINRPSTAAEQSDGRRDQPAEKTAEQAYKNIQVLKGLPESQMRPLMNLVSTSLGFTCVNCHVKSGDRWEFDRDDKKHKQTARKMIQMTLEINKAHFDGKPEVTCFACHQGHGHPPAVPPVPMTAHNPNAVSAPPAKPINPQQVLVKYIQAVGGKEAAERLKTRVLKGEHVMLDGARWPVEIRFTAPDKVLVTLTTPNQGISYQGLQGSSGWIKNAREQRAMDSVELARIRSLTWSLEPLPLKEPYPRMFPGGVEKVGDREAAVLQMALPDKRRVRLFFDTQTGLLLRRVVFTPTVLGADPEQTDYDDYREVDGVKVPFSIHASYLDTFFSSVRQFSEIKHNAPLESSLFDPPKTVP